MALTQVKALGIAADAIDETKLADDSIDSEHYNDASIDNAHLADDAVGIAELSATGTASSSTFLRGDNSWVTPTDTNTTYSVGDGGLTTNDFTNADHTKLNGIEASADVTDATNVNAAGAIMHSDLGTKGQIVVGDGSGDATILAVGSNDHVLTADSSEASGVKWAAASGGATINNATANEIVTVASTTTQLDAEANLTFDGTDLTVGTGNVIIGTNGKGIDFAANTDDEGAAGSVSAEVLNDYEVGTFTPTIDDGSATFGYHTQTGNYMKIGDLVHIELYIRLSSSSSTSANKIHIGGLPFSAATAHNAMRVGYTYGVADDDSPRIGRVNGNQIECFKDYGHSSALYNAVFDGGDERITFSVTYRTS